MDGRKEKLTAGYSYRFRDMKKSSSYIFILKENKTSPMMTAMTFKSLLLDDLKSCRLKYIKPLAKQVQ